MAFRGCHKAACELERIPDNMSVTKLTLNMAAYRNCHFFPETVKNDDDFRFPFISMMYLVLNPRLDLHLTAQHLGEGRGRTPMIKGTKHSI